MTSADSKRGRLRIGSRRVDFLANSVSDGKTTQRLEPRLVKVLAYLTENRERIVPREELLDNLWPEEFTSDEVLTAAVRSLRKALGDDARNPRYIKTFPRVGYQLVAPVEAAGSPRPRPRAAQSASIKSVGPFPGRTIWVGSALALTAATLLYAGYRLGTPRTGLDDAVSAPSLMVFPFENSSPNEEDGYLSKGTSGHLRGALARTLPIRVISSTSSRYFQKQEMPLPEIASRAGVTLAVEGSAQLHGDRVAIEVRLVQASSDEHLWSRSYLGRLEDLFSLQQRIVSEVTQAIGLTPRTDAPNWPAPRSSAAYVDYLKGRFLWEQRSDGSIRRAAESFMAALDVDPDFAPAWAGLADCYSYSGGRPFGLEPSEARQKAGELVEKAISLSPDLAEARTSLAAIRKRNRDWSGAEKEFLNSIRLNPNSRLAHQWYGELLAAMGRHSEAQSSMRRAAALDPASLTANGDLAWILYLARDLEAAEEQIHETLRLNPDYFWMNSLLAYVYELQGKPDEALKQFRRLLELQGVEKAAREDFQDIESLDEYRLSQAQAKSSDLVWIAILQCRLGRLDEAMNSLERALQQGAALTWLKVSPDFDPLRRMPRFQALLSATGLG